MRAITERDGQGRVFGSRYFREWTKACGPVHHWGRELRKLGHDVRLMPATHAEPYVKRGKTADAEAISEAVRPPSMRFVEIKLTDQQAFLAVHRSRDLLVRQRKQVVNMIRSVLRGFGYVLLWQAEKL